MKKVILTLVIALFGLLSSFVMLSEKSPTSNVETAANTTIKFELEMLARPHTTVLQSPSLYGFVGIQVFKVTASKTELIKSFGNKSQYFFNTTEDKAFPKNGDVIYTLPDSPNYKRDFLIPTSDWTDPNIRYEVRIWHHLKGKLIGSNIDYHKYSQTYDLKKLIYNVNKTTVTVKKTSNSSYVVVALQKQ